MNAIILAAGRGSRLGDLTAGRPKCLVELFGQPLLRWQIDALRRAGAGRVAVVRGYRGETLEGFGVDLFDNPRWADTNMVMSLAAAAAWLRAGPCIVSYSDIVYPAAAVTRLMAARSAIALTYDVNWHALWSRRFANPLEDAETFAVDPSGRLTDIGRRPGRIDEVGGQYMGLLRLAPEGWGWIEALLADLGPAADRLDMTGMLARLIAAGRPVEAIAYDGVWGEVDSPDDLALYQAMADLPARLAE